MKILHNKATEVIDVSKLNENHIIMLKTTRVGGGRARNMLVSLGSGYKFVDIERPMNTDHQRGGSEKNLQIFLEKFLGMKIFEIEAFTDIKEAMAWVMQD